MFGGQFRWEPVMSANSQVVARFVSVVMGLVIGLTFLFGFGNVLSLALKLQVPVFVAPLVAPAVDLTVLGLLVGTRHLALSGASDDVLRAGRRLLTAASVGTLLLNVADPVCVGEWGKAAFDSVGPFLLIGWAEVGVRHEALFDRVEVRGLHPLSVVTGGVELRAA